MADQNNTEKGEGVPAKSPDAGAYESPELARGKTGGAQNNIEFLLDVPLQLSVELGRTKMFVNDLLQLGQGSVIELKKMAGEPLEIMVNEKLVARGEVVLVNEKFAVRVTDIVSPKERIESLA